TNPWSATAGSYDYESDGSVIPPVDATPPQLTFRLVSAANAGTPYVGDATADIYTASGVIVGSVDFTAAANGDSVVEHEGLEYDTTYRVGLRNAVSSWALGQYVEMTTQADPEA